jgi:histidinol phosphatase-like enzyme
MALDIMSPDGGTRDPGVVSPSAYSQRQTREALPPSRDQTDCLKPRDFCGFLEETSNYLSAFSCDAGLREPEAKVYLRMARELGISPASAVMVGDSRRSDYDGARAVGMEAVLLRRSGESRGDRVIKSLRELPGEIRL